MNETAAHITNSILAMFGSETIVVHHEGDDYVEATDSEGMFRVHWGPDGEPDPEDVAWGMSPYGDDDDLPQVAEGWETWDPDNEDPQYCG